MSNRKDVTALLAQAQRQGAVNAVRLIRNDLRRMGLDV